MFAMYKLLQRSVTSIRTYSSQAHRVKMLLDTPITWEKPTTPVDNLIATNGSLKIFRGDWPDEFKYLLWENGRYIYNFNFIPTAWSIPEENLDLPYVKPKNKEV